MERNEASVGINRKAQIRGVQREDENIFGCVHLRLGTNVDVGMSLSSRIYKDGVILEPTLYVDGEKESKRDDSGQPESSRSNSA